MAFTNLRDATREDWDRIDALDEARTDYSDAPLELLRAMKDGTPLGTRAEPVSPQPPGGHACLARR